MKDRKDERRHSFGGAEQQNGFTRYEGRQHAAAPQLNPRRAGTPTRALAGRRDDARRKILLRTAHV